MRGVRMGMAGGPLTAFIIVMEMVSGQAMVLSLMACALLPRCGPPPGPSSTCAVAPHLTQQLDQQPHGR
jgi:hypothetical protein